MEQAEKRQSIRGWIDENKITVDLRSVCSRPDGLMDGCAFHWRFTLRFPAAVTITGKTATFGGYFSQGAGCKTPPSAAEILDSLISDVSDVGEPFADWCANLGFDTDSRKAEKIYRTCKRTYDRLYRIVGDEMDTLIYGVDRL